MIDIFSGSNTTGRVAEELGRRWLSVEIDPKYARLSAVRFLEGENIASIREALGSLERGEVRQIRVRAQPQTPGRKTSRQATTRQRRLKASSGQKDLF